jgi:two-component system OmpR family sensor kinase
MSIRLRLTLLYSAILILTLVAFGALLYVRQYEETLEIEKQFLINMGERFADGRRPPPPDTDLSQPPPPPEPSGQPPGPEPSEQPPEPDSSGQLDDFGGGYLVRRSPDGQEILDLRTPDDVVLPLSDDAFQAVQNGETWMETATVEGERVLIYTVPILVEGQLSEILQMGRSITTRDQSIRALGMNLLIAGIVAVVVAFGLGWVLAGMSLRPIHRLTQTAEAIGAERDFSQRVEHSGPDDEVGRLAKTLNAMLSELQAAYQQVGQALEMQQRFVADVSHELRTPLTTLNGNVELLRREPPISAEDRSEVLSDMASESKRLIRLVNDLLALARADARRPLQSEPVRIKPIIEEACRQARLLAPDREIACDAPPDVAAMGQADAIKQVLLILLDNAIRHADGPITITGDVAEKCVTVSVRDSGPGIEPETLPSLFERFSRGSVSEGENGTGLGLAIAKALVEAQGGTLTIGSQPGEGSVFSVTLPQASTPHRGRPANP